MKIRPGDSINIKQFLSDDTTNYVFITKKGNIYYCFSPLSLETILVPENSIIEENFIKTNYEVKNINDIYTIKIDNTYYLGKIRYKEYEPDQWLVFNSRESLYNTRDAIISMLY